MLRAHFDYYRGRNINLLFFLLTAAVWLEPGSCISLHHQSYESRRAPREAGTDPGAANSLQFDLLTDTSADCVERLGSSVSVELSYRTPSGDWETLRLLTRVPGDCDSVSNREAVQLPSNILNEAAIQFRWLQQEQAWGDCNCWQISNVSLSVNNSQFFSYFGDGANDLNNDFACAGSQASTGQLSCFTGGEGLVFCSGSASVPRGVATPMYDLSTRGIVGGSCTASDLFEPIGDVQFCAHDGTEETFIDVSFQLAFQRNVGPSASRLCDRLESFDEGVELAIRRSEDEQWVPLKFYTVASRRSVRIDIGRYDQDNSILSLRGYNVSVVAGDTSVMSVSECICDERFFQEGIQFRWLQTALRNPTGLTARDTWFIDNVEITVNGGQKSSRTEFSDDFSAQFINGTLWSQVRGARGGTAGIDTRCVPEDGGGVLFFGINDTLPNMSERAVAVTRMAVMKPLNLVPEINECAEGRDDCDENAVCTDTDRSFTCTCQGGYTRNGTVCTNVDECTVGIADCDMNADCTDNDGSFTCLCREGYTGSGTVCTNNYSSSSTALAVMPNSATTPADLPNSSTDPAAMPSSSTDPAAMPSSSTDPAAIPSSSTDPAVIPSTSTTPATMPNSSTAPAAMPSFSTDPATMPSFSTAPAAMPSSSAAPAAMPSFSTDPAAMPSFSTAPAAMPSFSTDPAAMPSSSTAPAAMPSSSTAPAAMPTSSTDPAAMPSSSTAPAAMPSFSTDPAAMPSSSTAPAAMPSSSTDPAAMPSSSTDPAAMPSSSTAPAAMPSSSTDPAAMPSSSTAPAAMPSFSTDPAAMPSSSTAPAAMPSFSTDPATMPSFSTAPAAMPSFSTDPAAMPSFSTAPAAMPSSSTAPAAMPSFSTDPAAMPSSSTAPAAMPSSSTAPAAIPSFSTDPAAMPSSSTAPAAMPNSSTAPAAMPSSSTALVSAVVMPTSVISSTTVLSSSDAPPLSSTTVASTPPSATPTQASSETLQMFTDLFNDTEEVRPSVVLSTLRDMLGNLSIGSTFPLNTSQLLFNSLSNLIGTIQQSDGDADNTTGSTLLYVLDRFALGPYDPEQGELEDTGSIALVHMVLSTSDGDPSDPVEVIAINGNMIGLPSEVFMICNTAEVSVASYFYHNLSGLLPNSLPGDSQSSATTMRLNSSVLSSALQCGSMQYDTRNLNLTNPVVITFSHPQGLEQQDGRMTSFICAFWEFDDFTNGLIGGHWSTEGCTRNDTASNENQIICECNHLTHFALLLNTTEILSEAVLILLDLFNDTRAPSEILIILRGVLRSLPAGITFPPEVSEQLFSFLSDLIDTVQQMDNNGGGSTDIGSTLVDVLDRFALGPYDPQQGELEDTDNIALVHMVQSTSGGDAVEGISRNGSRIVLPREVFMIVNRPEVPVASYYYRNMSGLLPDSIPGDSENSSTTTMKLASPILSSALQCGSTQCNTRDLNLTNPVVLVFRHSPQIVDDLGQQDGRESSVICVFLNLNDSSANGLISGQWDTEGCTRNDTASNESQTVCECNHLTHFALLLSTTEILLTSADALSLRIIGIICVTLSLICLTATIFTYLFLKPLWNMRN